MRGLASDTAQREFLAADLAHLTDPLQMKGMAEAVARIRRACEHGEKILIHGDYDVDGVTAAAIMARTLTDLGASFETFLPDRADDGYGVSERAIREAASRGITVLITVDCGITAHEQLAAAKSLGVDTIVIDHHRIPSEGLPPAAVILNPLQPECAYPFKELSAGGLAFKFSQALIGPRAIANLDLAALSTVGDVAPLNGENRIVVRHGLKQLSERATPGIKALSEAASIKARQMNTAHIGFMLGPRINAAGRMSSPQIALRLLMTESPREAESLARILEEENKTRQREERQVVKEAVAEVERTVNFNRDRVIVVGRRGWHAGVIGIVASRLVDRYHRPAVVIAFGEGNKGKGSGRSIKNFNLFLALQSCQEFFEAFGGHPQAAGLSIMEEHLAAFRRRINEYAAAEYAPEIFVRSVTADLEIGLSEINARFIRELELFEPHGAGNPRPVFRTAGLHLKGKPQMLSPQTAKFWLTDGSVVFQAVWSDRAGEGFPAWLGKEIQADVAYSVKAKMRDGIEEVSLEIKEIKPLL